MINSLNILGRMSLCRLHEDMCLLSGYTLIYTFFLLQKEREVLALLSRLDLQNIHFTDSPPGMFLI